MKITKQQLRRIIREEKGRILQEREPDWGPRLDAPVEGYIPNELHMEVMDFLNDMTEIGFKGSDMIKKRAIALVNKIEG